MNDRRSTWDGGTPFSFAGTEFGLVTSAGHLSGQHEGR